MGKYYSIMHAVVGPRPRISCRLCEHACISCHVSDISSRLVPLVATVARPLLSSIRLPNRTVLISVCFFFTAVHLPREQGHGRSVRRAGRVVLQGREQGRRRLQEGVWCGAVSSLARRQLNETNATVLVFSFFLLTASTRHSLDLVRTAARAYIHPACCPVRSP